MMMMIRMMMNECSRGPYNYYCTNPSLRPYVEVVDSIKGSDKRVRTDQFNY